MRLRSERIAQAEQGRGRGEVGLRLAADSVEPDGGGAAQVVEKVALVREGGGVAEGIAVDAKTALEPVEVAVGGHRRLAIEPLGGIAGQPRTLVNRAVG